MQPIKSKTIRSQPATVEQAGAIENHRCLNIFKPLPRTLDSAFNLDGAQQRSEFSHVDARSVTHLFTFFESLGGVQSILQHHRDHDRSWGLDSRFVNVFERASREPARLIALKQTGLGSIRSTRRAFQRLAQPCRDSQFLYHNLWGLPILADLDGSARRIGVLHSDWPTLDNELETASGLLDGLLCVSRSLVAKAQAAFPRFGSDRIQFLPYPVNAPTSVMQKVSEKSEPPLKEAGVTIGFCGRLQRTQKRIDRLRGVMEGLRAAGVRCRLEILGAGPEEPWLRRDLSGFDNVVWHGLRRGEEYWQILASWDVILFVSDYEGLPIAMLEALSLGVLPIYPRIGSGGDDYVGSVAAELLYTPSPAGTQEAAIRTVIQLVQSRPEHRQALRQLARKASAPHSMANYFGVVSRFCQTVAALPRVSSEKFHPRTFRWADHLPYAVLERVCRSEFFVRPIAMEGTTHS